MTSKRRKVSTIGMILRADSPEAVQFGAKLQLWLENRNIVVWTAQHRKGSVELQTMPDLDLLLVLGGDGTILATARNTVGRKIPLAGINFGRVGFLAEMTRETWQEHLERIIKNGLEVERRLTLRFSLVRNEEIFLSGEAVNDLVVNRGVMARLGMLSLDVDGQPFVNLRADGIIFSTPTGSTGYAGSAGGPMLLPSLELYQVVPICPFLNNFPPLLMEPTTRMTATVSDTGTELFLTIDGQTAVPLQSRDRLEVTGEPGGFLMARIDPEGYFQRLVRAGFIQQAKR